MPRAPPAVSLLLRISLRRRHTTFGTRTKVEPFAAALGEHGSWIQEVLGAQNQTSPLVTRHLADDIHVVEAYYQRYGRACAQAKVVLIFRLLTANHVGGYHLNLVVSWGRFFQTIGKDPAAVWEELRLELPKRVKAITNDV